MWWPGRNSLRLGQVEDLVRDLRAAVARFEASDVARAAGVLEATDKLNRTAERLRKQADRVTPPEDADDDFYDRLAAARGYPNPREA